MQQIIGELETSEIVRGIGTPGRKIGGRTKSASRLAVEEDASRYVEKRHKSRRKDDAEDQFASCVAAQKSGL